ncbi:glycosyltransferase family 2 protein [Methylobacterium pseudosasicola]|uniref:Glycosyl transferase family 2 n=1 Tax=Methylobacterium pseudosasicola TaxID=582667 RepID=A0A1I4VBW3_9HYPH|nr:glycosyltransferase family 2 protein [Methylobacterium pseudosasicola]SFM98665.1 Glycosyl transferase family 2 [Methylobacterium pseudosasicola]
MPSISIAMATYNGERYIEDQLNSIVEQSLAPDELVVRDDGSTDRTIMLLEKFASYSPFPVKILTSNKRLGYAENFLAIGAACRGDYIMFSDQDDVWLPNKIRMGLEAIVGDDSLISIHTSVIVDDKLNKISIGRQGIHSTKFFNKGDLNPHENGWGHQMMFDRRLLQLIDPSIRPKGQNGRPLSHDIWIYSLAATLGRVSHINQPLCLYRQHNNNADGAGQQDLIRKFWSFFEVPIYRYEYRREFCKSMAEICSNTADVTTELSMKKNLEEASVIYQSRLKSNEARLRLYRESRFLSRVEIFIKHERTRDLGGAKNITGIALGNAKDLLLGVFSLGRIVHK